MSTGGGAKAIIAAFLANVGIAVAKLAGFLITGSSSMLAEDVAPNRLERAKAEIVDLRYFAGLSVEETADALDLSPRAVNRHWTAARAWSTALFSNCMAVISCRRSSAARWAT